MRKSRIKFALERAMKPYYTSGFTTTADKVRREFWKQLDILYKMDNKK